MDICVSFLEMRWSGNDHDEPYATYEVVSAEGDREWRVLTRWSKLARLWSELRRKHWHTLRSASLPAFYQHTLRSKASPALCAERAATMQALLLSAQRDASGLTLTAASHVIICEPQPDVAVEQQMVGRVHRIGQTRQTHVHRVVISGTFEPFLASERLKIVIR